MSNLQDPFAKVPEFLAAFDNILDNGFFDSLNLDVNTSICGGLAHCTIKITGYIPRIKRYMQDGCGVMIDPHVVIDSCRKLSRQRRIWEIRTNVESVDWPKWTDNGQEIIGSKGSRTTLSFHISFR